ncbi:MAG: LysM peptidoglycan-binding domain-containing protein [candidate division WOR-3 bacterium]
MKRFILTILLVGSFSLIAQYKKHTVVKGECLWFIAEHYYNNPFLWPVIYEANKDSIADPHWIYPGEVFVIPNVPAEQEVTPPLKEGLVTELKGAKGKLIEEKRKAISTKKTPLELWKEEPVLFSVIKPETYAFTRKAALSAGFITTDHSLEKGEVEKILYGEAVLEGSPTTLGDKVQVNIGKSKGVEEDKLYTIFKWDKEIFGYGRIVRIKGILKIIEAGEKVSKARIIDSYEKIEVGDKIMDYIPPEIKAGKVKPTLQDLKGKIIAFKEDEDVVKPFSVAYIEPGKNKDVQLGDVFLIYREQGGRERDLIKPLGEIQIVNVQDKTASGYITSIMGNTDISTGDKVRLVGRIGGE